jgi:SNF2 family DNA or RNA helicase
MCVEAPFNEDTKAALAWLPNSAYNSSKRAWRARVTDAASYRLLVEGYELDDELMMRARGFGIDHRCDILQPHDRVMDSWHHQASMYSRMATSNTVLLDVRMGLGKTKPIVDEFVNSGFMLGLIVCPKSVLGVWRREFVKWSPIEVEVLVLDSSSWTSPRKAKEIAKHIEHCQRWGKPCVVVVNYESVWRDKIAKELLKHWWDVVIADESHRIKNPDSKACKFLCKLTWISKWRRCLSGTPMAHSPVDAFGQFKFLDPGLFGTSWPHFRSRYAKTGHFGANHIVGYIRQEEQAELMSHLTIRYDYEDTDIELPPLTIEDVPVQLDKETRRKYLEIEKLMVTEVKDQIITVDNALTKLMKLRQIASGFIKDEDGEVHVIGTEKIKILKDQLEDIPKDEPVVVFCNFREDLKQLRQLAADVGREYGEISGQQKDLTEHSTMPEWVDLMGVQIQSGGTGIDLTRSRYVYYFDPTWNLADFDQSMKRAHRPGQTRATFVKLLTSVDTVDQKVYQALTKRRNIIEAVMEMLENYQNAA